MMRKVNVSGIFFLSPPKLKGKKDCLIAGYQCSCNQDFPEIGPTASFV